jgi:hypothetical protein
VPLTEFQRALLAVLAPARSPDSYLAGGAALHFTPQSLRYSRDLLFFHDSEERVAGAFAGDRETLDREGYEVGLLLSQPGTIRALVSKGDQSTQVEWAHDSTWRFMPVVQDELGGYLLHEMDLAVNKVLALAGRNEVRDFVDVVYLHREVLPLGALVWAAVGKDPGFNPASLLERLSRRGRYRPEDVARLDLARPFDLVRAKEAWLQALDAAEAFVARQPPDELGALYWSTAEERFVAPDQPDSDGSRDVVPHFGRPGGVLPTVAR